MARKLASLWSEPRPALPARGMGGDGDLEGGGGGEEEEALRGEFGGVIIVRFWERRLARRELMRVELRAGVLWFRGARS